MARPLPSPEPQTPPPFSGWIRLERDLPLYQDSSTGATRIGSLAKGVFAYADEAPNRQDGIYWLQIEAPLPNGFIAAGEGGKLFIHRYLVPPGASGGSVNGIAASPRSFVAWGYSSGRSNETSTPFVAASADGRSWKRVDYRPFGSAFLQSVAWGPAGWIAVGRTATTNAAERDLWVWTSQDGRAWRVLGALPMNAAQSDISLLASDEGYLVLSENYRSSDQTSETWWSSDGSSWTKGALPSGINGNLQHVVATRSGFYAWPDPQAGPRTVAAYTADGQHWVDLAAPPISGNGRVVALGAGLLAVDVSPVTGAPRAWVGTFSNGGIGWIEVSSRPPRNFGFGTLASDGATVVLFGWNRLTDAPAAWEFDGSQWTPVPLDRHAFGGVVPSMAVASPFSFVIVGSNLNLRADNPVIWSGTPAADDWAPEASPVVAAVDERTDLHCPSRPPDAAAFASLDAASAVICFGRSPITFRAYVGSCDGCSGSSGDVYTPAWLADPYQNQLYLSPIEQDGWSYSSRRAATLADDPAAQGHWVQVIGHFDDPASATCRWVPDPHSGGVFSSTQSTVNGCRTQFVVTDLQIVAGP